MDFTYNKFEQRDEIVFYLCNPNRDEIGVINARNRAFTLRFNDLSEMTCEVDDNCPYYDLLEAKRLIKADTIGWFQITSVTETDNGTYKYKSISTESHQTTLKNFGFVSEERTYCFYNEDDPLDSEYDSTDTSEEGVAQVPSVVGQLYKQGGIKVALRSDYADYSPEVDYEDWTIIYISNSLIGSVSKSTGTYRTFEEESEYVYDFMTGDAGDAFGVVFDFDILHHTIKVKTTDEIAEKSNIYLSHANLIQDLEVTEESEDIVTVLTCTGDDLDIVVVNPMGTAYILDFNYYKQIIEETDASGNVTVTYPWMTKELIEALDAWQVIYDNYAGNNEDFEETTYPEYVEIYYNLMEQIEPYNSEIEYNNLMIDSIDEVQSAYSTWASDTQNGTLEYDEDDYGATNATFHSVSEVAIVYDDDANPTGVDYAESYPNSPFSVVESKKIKLKDITYTLLTGSYTTLPSTIYLQNSSGVNHIKLTFTTTENSGKYKYTIEATPLKTTVYKAVISLVFKKNGTDDETEYEVVIPSRSTSASKTTKWMPTLNGYLSSISAYIYTSADLSEDKKTLAENFLGTTFNFYLYEPQIVDGLFSFVDESGAALSAFSGTPEEAYQKMIAAGTKNIDDDGNYTGEDEDAVDDSAYIYFTDDATGKTFCKLTGYAIVDSETETATYHCGGYKRYCLAKYVQTAIEGYTDYNAYLISVIGEEDDEADVDGTLYAQSNYYYAKMQDIVSKVNIVNYFADESNFAEGVDNEKLWRELKCYWIEGEYEDEYLSGSDDMAEQIKLAKELMENGKTELAKVNQPRYSFTVSTVDFTRLYKYKQFMQDLELGTVITIQKDENTHYYPALTEMEFNLDDPEDFSLTFSNAYKMNDWGFTMGDLLNEASSVSRQVSSNWSDIMSYSKSESEINNLLTNTLDLTLRYANKNLYNQEFTIDTSGILGRQYNDDSKSTFANEQMRITNNVILFTDDAWQTVKTALGKVCLGEDDYGNPIYSYGLAAEVVVGDLLLGDALQISNGSTDNSSITINGNGITITDGSGETVFNVTTNGEVTVKNYATTTDLDNYATTSDLSNYVTTTSFSEFKTTVDGISSTVGTIEKNYVSSDTLDSTLNGYVTTTTFSTLEQTVNGFDFSVYATTEDLNGYVTTTAFSTLEQTVSNFKLTVENDYATKAELVLEIKTDTSGNSYAYLSGYASYISFDADKYITITSPYFTLDKDGYITATGGTIGGLTISDGGLSTSDFRIRVETDDGGNTGAILDFTADGSTSISSSQIETQLISCDQLSTSSLIVTSSVLFEGDGSNPTTLYVYDSSNSKYLGLYNGSSIQSSYGGYLSFGTSSYENRAITATINDDPPLSSAGTYKIEVTIKSGTLLYAQSFYVKYTKGLFGGTTEYAYVIVAAGASSGAIYVDGGTWGVKSAAFSDGTTETTIYQSTASSYNISTNCSISPYMKSDTAYSLGSTDTPWSYVYANMVDAATVAADAIYLGDTPVSTSDKNKKKEISYINEKSYAVEIFNNLKPAIFKFKNGTSGRRHIGFIAQDIEETIKSLGIDSNDFGAYCKWSIKDKNGDEVETYGLRYEEFIALNTFMIKLLEDRIKKLEEARDV